MVKDLEVTRMEFGNRIQLPRASKLSYKFIGDANIPQSQEQSNKSSASKKKIINDRFFLECP